MRLRLGIRVRLIHAWRRAWRWSRQRSRRPFIQHAVEKLHIGCGPQARSGWTNVDIELNHGVDFVLDVLDALPTTLRPVGFADIWQCRYGESADTTSLPHVVIVEARGVAHPDRAALDDLLDDYDWAMHP